MLCSVAPLLFLPYQAPLVLGGSTNFEVLLVQDGDLRDFNSGGFPPHYLGSVRHDSLRLSKFGNGCHFSVLYSGSLRQTGKGAKGQGTVSIYTLPRLCIEPKI